MALEELLAGMGMVPQGVRPKNIDLSAGETEATWQDTSTMARVAKGLKQYFLQRQEEEKKRQEELKRQTDIYNTLRNAGYSSEEAFKTSKSNKFPVAPGGKIAKEQKEESYFAESQARVKRTEAETERAKAQAEKTRMEMGILPEESKARIEKIQAEIERIRQDMVVQPDDLKKQEQQLRIDKLNAEIEKIKSPAPLKAPKLSEAQQFREDINAARKGEIAWDELTDKYSDKPEKIAKLEKMYTAISKSPKFKKGTGGLISRIKSKLSPHQAEVNEETQRVINNIKTEADWDEFLKDIKDYQEAGVDVEAVKEYFGRR